MPPKEDHTLAIVLFCCVCPIVFLIVFPLVLLYIFGVLFLVLDYSVCRDASQLWIFSAFVLLEPLLHIVIPTAGTTLWISILFSTFLFAVSFVYGAVILFGGYVCDEMKSQGLYVWALVAWSFISIVLVSSFASISYILTLSKDEWEEIEISSRINHKTVDLDILKMAFAFLHIKRSSKEDGTTEREPLVQRRFSPKDIESRDPDTLEGDYSQGGVQSNIPFIGGVPVEPVADSTNENPTEEELPP